MFYSTRSKLIASFLVVSFLVGAVSLVAGGLLLYSSVIRDASNRVRLDLNAAVELYETAVDFVKVSLNITTLGSGFRSAVMEADIQDLIYRLNRMTSYAELDFAGIITHNGKTLCRIGPNAIPASGAQPDNPIVLQVLNRKAPVAGTVIFSEAFLLAENPYLAKRARIPIVPTPLTGRHEEVEERSGMALAAAVPVFEESCMVAILYGGILLNRSQKIVDTVRDTVFQNETYHGRVVGTSTVFFRDLRISTNVTTGNAKRAIGTRVSEAVKAHVLDKGDRWTERAFVVNDWYITAYEPIEDIFGRRVGMLYVGILEAKYIDIVKKVLAVFVLTTLAGMVLAVILGCIVSNKIMSPVRRLTKASQQVARGSLKPDIGPVSRGEMGVLQNNFKEMVAALDRRRAESQNQLLLSEKQASVGRLAAGVAHEINNPLTGVLTYTHMLLRREDLSKEIRDDLKTIVEATERVRTIVKGLLGFSRQTKLDRALLEINDLVRSTIFLMENQALVRGVDIHFLPGSNLPPLTLDRSQFQGVLLNIILNALDATKAGGDITVSTTCRPPEDDGCRPGVAITIEDTGCGIPPEHLDKLFDPFFTTKAVGQGTGLGLSVSLGIVQRHGGTIRVDSDGEKGSTFTIWLPVDVQQGVA
jgi:two-component system NtrC family sensor kinase